jgi:hypothetical protein
MRLRGITRSDVRWLIARGIREPAPSIVGRAARWSYRGYIGHREAKLIVIESQDCIDIVTVEWTDERTSTTA